MRATGRFTVNVRPAATWECGEQQDLLACLEEGILLQASSMKASTNGRHPDAGSSACATLRPEIIPGDGFALIQEQGPQTIDLILTSPPYWGLRTYGLTHNWDIEKEWRAHGGTPTEAPPYEWYRQHGGVLGLEPYPDWYVAHLVEFFSLAAPALKESGSIWVNVGDTYFARWSSIRDRGRQGLGGHPRERRRVPMGGYRQEKQLLLIPARFAIAMQENRWILRNDLIWYKPNVPPRPEKDRLKLSHEHFFHFVKRPKQGRAKYYYDKRFVEQRDHDVVRYSVRPGQGGHSATFPEALITPRILSSCPPEGVVLDPFCGTGTTLTVAHRLGRRGIGFELSPAFLPEETRAQITASEC